MRTTYSNRKIENEFGDSRLNRRFGLICEQFQNNLSGTIPQVAQIKSSAKAMYRFFDNTTVTSEKMLFHHQSSLNDEIKEGTIQRFFQIDDTTELDFTNKKGAQQLGPLNFLKRRGLLLHSSLILSEKAIPVGLLHQSYIQRPDADFGKSAKRKLLPIEERESFRWLAHFRKGQALCEQNEHLEGIYIADREADLMELYHQRNCDRMHLLIRSKHNRHLLDEPDKLFDHLANQPQSGVYQVTLTNAQTNQPRQATIEVRYCRVTIKMDKQRPHTKHLRPVELYAIEAKEVTAHVEQAIHWRLLTTLPVENFENAMQVISYYTHRWIIERFHYLLKSGGAHVEELQLHTAHRLKNAITTYSIATLNVFKIKYLAMQHPDKKINEVGITETEYKVLYTYANKHISSKIQFQPQQYPTIKEYCIVLGQIGGFFPSKKQKIPGLKILARAVHKLNILIDAYFSFFQ